MTDLLATSRAADSCVRFARSRNVAVSLPVWVSSLVVSVRVPSENGIAVSVALRDSVTRPTDDQIAGVPMQYRNDSERTNNSPLLAAGVLLNALESPANGGLCEIKRNSLPGSMT